MLYHLSRALLSHWGAFNVIHYVSFRACAALLTAFFLSFLLGQAFITSFRELFKARARDQTPDSHRIKDNTPTMGGLLILAVVVATVLLWGNLLEAKLWVFLLTLCSFGTIGAWDDWQKITQKKGVSEAHKFMGQVMVGLICIGVWWLIDAPSTSIVVPFFKSLTFVAGPFFGLWALWVMLCTVNAVNFTDGLDGLASITLIFNFVTFALIAYVVGNAAWAEYLYLPYAGTAELTVCAAALVGALLGFLWYNAYPAEIFMGDAGSLSLGAGLAMIALMAKQELLIPIAGGLFVVEGVSVALQIGYFKFFKKRIFRMAPLHHHFELLGWPESKITIRFAIITFLLCVAALVTLKMR